MATTNVRTPKTPAPKTHEGAPAVRNHTAMQELRRASLAALLWEDAFYEGGKAHAKRVADLVAQCDPVEVAALAVEAREQQHLRHLPLFLAVCLGKHPELPKGLLRRTLGRIIQRPDEISEFVSLFWTHAGRKAGRRTKAFPLPISMRRGLADAFRKFNAYSLAKYRGDDKTVKLSDVLRLARPKPKDAEQAELFKALRTGTLKAFDTWETELSAGKDKLATWTRLIEEQKLGGLALLRNLRNMQQAGVPPATIKKALRENAFKRVLPFRFLAARDHAPSFVAELGDAMERVLASGELPKLPGTTVVLIDVSGSMEAALSDKSDMTRMHAACGMAIVVRALADHARVYSFSDGVVEVPNYRGLALSDALLKSQPHSGTYLGRAIEAVPGPYDRIIVLTDEQSADRVGAPRGKGYMVNVASYEHGVGYGDWTRINGWSERLLDFVRAAEQDGE